MNIYLKGFKHAQDFTEDDLRVLCDPFGKITGCSIKKNDDGHSKGFGFVSFEEHKSARDLVSYVTAKGKPNESDDASLVKKIPDTEIKGVKLSSLFAGPF